MFDIRHTHRESSKILLDIRFFSSKGYAVAIQIALIAHSNAALGFWSARDHSHTQSSTALYEALAAFEVGNPPISSNLCSGDQDLHSGSADSLSHKRQV